MTPGNSPYLGSVKVLVARVVPDAPQLCQAWPAELPCPWEFSEQKLLKWCHSLSTSSDQDEPGFLTLRRFIYDRRSILMKAPAMKQLNGQFFQFAR